jgi:integrase
LNRKSISTYRNHFRHLLLWAQEELLQDADKINPSFSEYLASVKSPKTEKKLSRSTWERIFGSITRFYAWAKNYHSARFSRVPHWWLDALVVPANIVDHSNANYVSKESVQLFAQEYEKTDGLTTKRDCAAAIMLYLSGMRARAFVTLPIRAVRPQIPGYTNIMEIYQYPELGVETKNAKRFDSQTLPITEFYEIVLDWDNYLRPGLPETAPWFNVLDNKWGEISLSENDPGKNRGHLLNRRLKSLFGLVNAPYLSAHNFRRGHTMWGISHSENIEQYKTVSQNLGHASITITDQYYANFNQQDRRRIIANLGSN